MIVSSGIETAVDACISSWFVTVNNNILVL